MISLLVLLEERFLPLFDARLPALCRFPGDALQLAPPDIVLELRDLDVEGVKLLVDFLKFCSLLLLVALASAAGPFALIAVLWASSDPGLREG